jgi:hypothetical protein
MIPKQSERLKANTVKMTWKIVKYWLNFVYFHSCQGKWKKFGQTLSRTLTKGHGIQQSFS